MDIERWLELGQWVCGEGDCLLVTRFTTRYGPLYGDCSSLCTIRVRGRYNTSTIDINKETVSIASNQLTWTPLSLIGQAIVIINKHRALRYESRGARQMHSNTNQDNSFFPSGTRTHDTPLTRQSALPTELPGQLSRQGSTTQHKAKSNHSVL